jgi:hypothetical protein
MKKMLREVKNKAGHDVSQDSRQRIGEPFSSLHAIPTYRRFCGLPRRLYDDLSFCSEGVKLYLDFVAKVVTLLTHEKHKCS